jgi:hypothetical protein
MDELDLHSVRHHQVDRLVENFVFLKNLPARIITGNSPIMQQLVKDVLDRHNFSYAVENDWNLGAIIVTLKSKTHPKERQ